MYRRDARSHSVVEPSHTGVCCTIRATVHRAVRLGPMPDDAAAAVSTRWRQRMNRAFETVERVRASSETHLKCLVVVIAADFASCHRVLQSLVLC